MKAAPKSAQELIEEGQGLVHSLAIKIHNNVPVRIDLDDLIAYGQVGLAEAAKEFDPNRGSQFTTFAYYRVRGAIYDGLSTMSWTSRGQYHRMLRYERMANETLRQESEDHPASSDVGTVEEDARWLRNVAEKLAVVYLSTQGEGRDDADLFVADPVEQPLNIAITRELSEKLRELVDALPTAERKLIRATYYEGTTLQEAANRLGISKSWASRLHAKTLEQLSRLLRRMGAAD